MQFTFLRFFTICGHIVNEMNRKRVRKMHFLQLRAERNAIGILNESMVRDSAFCLI